MQERVLSTREPANLVASPWQAQENERRVLRISNPPLTLHDRKGTYKDHRLRMHAKQHAVTLCSDWVYKINVKIYLTFKIVTLLNAVISLPLSLFLSTYLPMSLSPVSNFKIYFDGSHWCTTEELYSKRVNHYSLLTCNWPGLLLCTRGIGGRHVHFVAAVPAWPKRLVCAH